MSLLLGMFAASCFSCSGSDTTRDYQSRLPARSLVPPPALTVIAVGDSISFSVWGYPEFTTKSYVKPSGNIMIPIMGEIKAAGYTNEEFARVLRQKLGEYIKGETKLTIEINSPIPRITVLGTVSRQGSFPANVEMSLLEVLSLAGGWTETSDLRYIKISRQAITGSESGSIEFDLTQYLDNGYIRNIPQVQPGDLVFVPKKENFVRELSGFLGDAFLLFGFFRVFN